MHKLVNGIKRIKRCDDSTSFEHAKESDGELETIRHHKRENVALAKAARIQRSSCTVNIIHELPVGEGALRRSIDQRWSVSDFVGPVEDKSGERNGWNRDMRRWTAKNHQSPQISGPQEYNASPSRNKQQKICQLNSEPSRFCN